MTEKQIEQANKEAFKRLRFGNINESNATGQITSLCNSDEYNYNDYKNDQYNYDHYYDYNSKKPEDYTVKKLQSLF